MAWEKRGKRLFYYRSVRVGSRVKKLYRGSGIVGQAAATADAARRQRRQADALAWREKQARLESVARVGRAYRAAGAVVMEAVLLAGGLHRVQRSPWRPWYGARDVLQNAGRAGGTH
jgi:hypothetical protein